MDVFNVLLFSFSLLSMVIYTSAQAPGCDLYTNPCVNGACQLQANQQYACACYPGFILDPTDPMVCHPIPPCNLLPLPPDQQCLNGYCQMQFTGEYACTCNIGYDISQSNPNICENINECMYPETGCAPGTCSDFPGDYSCSACRPGYVLNPYGKCQIQAQQPQPQPQGTQGNSYSNQWNNPFLWWAMDNWML